MAEQEKGRTSSISCEMAPVHLGLRTDRQPVEPLAQQEYPPPHFTLASTVALATGQVRVQPGPVKGDGVKSLQDIGADSGSDSFKEGFIGLVAHELRNPLTVITGALQTVLGEGPRLSPEMRLLISDAAIEAHSMTDILANMIDLFRTGANRLALLTDPVRLENIVATTVDKFRRRYVSHRFVVQVPDSLPEVSVDRVRIERVLHNLLHNAVKYSTEGHRIRVILKVAADELQISVRDHGIGISAMDQARLFQPFQRAGDANRIDAQGICLGLVVCRRIIEAHGGHIWLESKLGQGSTFSFTIPLWQPRADAHMATMVAPAPGSR